MKIMTWNVNAFSGKEDWNNLKNQKKLEETQEKNYTRIKEYLDSKFREDMDVVVLEEIPYKDWESSIKADFQAKYKVFFPREIPSYAEIATAIIAKKEEWNDEPNILFSAMVNRIVVINNNKIKVIGVHFPPIDKYYISHGKRHRYFKEESKRLWEELIDFCHDNKDVAIIAGDYNTDYMGYTQSAKMYDLCSLGFQEAKGAATRKCEGRPTTTVFGSHVDYVLIHDGIAATEYRIDLTANCLSDHYPVIANIQI